MIYGVGTDLVSIARIETALKNHGERFMLRILNADEVAECAECTGSAARERFIAKRFAVKEAFSKAFGTGIGAEVGWHDVAVAHAQSGKPYLALSDALQVRMRACGISASHVSISDEVGHALAFVVLETNKERA
jgi:holo-[acyl-carrier protein] synthase